MRETEGKIASSGFVDSLQKVVYVKGDQPIKLILNFILQTTEEHIPLILIAVHPRWAQLDIFLSKGQIYITLQLG